VDEKVTPLTPKMHDATIDRHSTVVNSKKLADGSDHHAVAMLNLTVMVTNDEGVWFAQGLEVDYAAQGDSLEEAKKHFEDGLHATIDVNLEKFQSLKHMLVPAPAGVWQEFFETESECLTYSQFSLHQFTGIVYDLKKAA
jgi:hypothetical protein